jgi:hypothetical protein
MDKFVLPEEKYLDEEDLRIKLESAPKSKLTAAEANFTTFNMFDKILLNNADNEKLRKKLLSYDDYSYA